MSDHYWNSAFLIPHFQILDVYFRTCSGPVVIIAATKNPMNK